MSRFRWTAFQYLPKHGLDEWTFEVEDVGVVVVMCSAAFPLSELVALLEKDLPCGGERVKDLISCEKG